MAHSVAPWGGRPVVNLIGGALQLPPALDTPRYDRPDRGPAANRGLIAYEGFGDAVVLRDIVRLWKGDGRLRGVLPRLRTYSLTEGEAEWAMSTQLDKLPMGLQKWVAGKGLYLFATHKEGGRVMEPISENSTTREGVPLPTSRQ